MAFSRINPPFLGAPLTNGKSHLLRMGIGVAPRCQSAPWIAKSLWPVFGYRRVCLFAFWMPQATRVVFAINSSWASCITQKYECCFQSPLLIHKLNFITINPTSSEQPFLPDLAESQGFFWVKLPILGAVGMGNMEDSNLQDMRPLQLSL